MFGFLDFFKQNNDPAAFETISNISSDKIEAGQSAHLFLLSKELLEGGVIDPIDSKELLRLNTTNAKKYQIYAEPKVKSKATGDYVFIRLDGKKVFNSTKCPACGNKLEGQVLTVEYKEVVASKGSERVEDAAALIMLHEGCANPYDLSDIQIKRK